MVIRSRRIVGTVSICVFALALTQDGFYLDRVPRNAWAPGWGEFAVGWISLFSGTLAWLGNPLLIASWIALFRKRVKGAAWFAFLAMLFMLSFLLNKKIVDSEAGSEARISGYGLGYWLWVLSSVVAAFGSLWVRADAADAAPASKAIVDPKTGPAVSEGKGADTR